MRAVRCNNRNKVISVRVYTRGVWFTRFDRTFLYAYVTLCFPAYEFIPKLKKKHISWVPRKTGRPLSSESRKTAVISSKWKQRYFIYWQKFFCTSCLMSLFDNYRQQNLKYYIFSSILLRVNVKQYWSSSITHKRDKR